jgi:hypothetical protein
LNEENEENPGNSGNRKFDKETVFEAKWRFQYLRNWHMQENVKDDAWYQL